MNNKALGTAFEKKLCKKLADLDYWVHFISPDNRGAQPFDIVAVKNNIPIAIDCKTSARSVFPYDRLEDNQKLAFEKWLRCGNEYAVIAVKFKERIYFIEYEWLEEEGKLKLADCPKMEEWLYGRF